MTLRRKVCEEEKCRVEEFSAVRASARKAMRECGVARARVGAKEKATRPEVERQLWCSDMSLQAEMFQGTNSPARRCGIIADGRFS
jgi:hypothetical protein